MLLKTQSQLPLKSHERSLPLQLVDKSLPKNWPVLRSNRLKLKVELQGLHLITNSRKRRRSTSWRSQGRGCWGSCWRNSRRKSCFRWSRRRRNSIWRGRRTRWRNGSRRARWRSWSRGTCWGHRSCRGGSRRRRGRGRGNYRCRGWNSCRACRVSGVNNFMLLELLLAV